MLLYFAYADFEEGRHKYEKVHQIYSKFLDIPEIDPTLVSLLFYTLPFNGEKIRRGARTTITTEKSFYCAEKC